MCLFVIGSTGGMCKVENKGIWFGTTEPNTKHPVSTASQTKFWSDPPGMCLHGKNNLCYWNAIDRKFLKFKSY
jgi:hypothetical protein